MDTGRPEISASATDHSNGSMVTESMSFATGMPGNAGNATHKQGKRAPVRTGLYDWFAGF